MRVWVLLTATFDVYIFQEGYLRLSSENYDLQDIENPFIHLTNNAIQKFSVNYGEKEDGNQLSYQKFQNFLDARGSPVNVRRDILPKIEGHVSTSMQSAFTKINKKERKTCFEIFGYDFIVDSKFNVWLIEINTNPCIEESSPMLAMYLPRMIDDALKLTMDKLFYCQFEKAEEGDETSRQVGEAKQEQKSFWPVEGYSDMENMWKLLNNCYNVQKKKLKEKLFLKST